MNRISRVATRGAVRVACLTAMIVVVDALALLLQRDHNAPHEAPAVLALVVAALSFAAERFPIDLSIKTERHTLSFNELALGLGVVYLSPMLLTAAILVGGGGALVAHRRQRGVKLAFNCAQLAAQAIAVTAVFAAFDDPSSASVRIVALMAALLVADIVSALLVSGAIALFLGSAADVVSRRALCVSLVESLGKCGAAVVAVSSVVYAPSLVGLAMSATAAGLYAVYRRSARVVAVTSA